MLSEGNLGGRKEEQKKLCFPTGPFTVSEPQNLEIGKFYVDHERRATEFEALKL